MEIYTRSYQEAWYGRLARLMLSGLKGFLPLEWAPLLKLPGASCADNVDFVVGGVCRGAVVVGSADAAATGAP